MPTGPNQPLVVAIVVTHAGPGDMLRRCIDALTAAGSIVAAVVVDNSLEPAGGRSGVDGFADVDRPEVQALSDTATDKGVHIHTFSVANHGFGAAVNAGVGEADRLVAASGNNPIGYYAVLNDDVVVSPGWLGPLKDAISADERIGGVQPKMLFAGSGPARINSLGVTLDNAGAGSDIGMGEPDGPHFAQATDIDIFSGGAVLLDAAFVHDLGGFDERYFLYYEDVDLALRGGERGWRFRCIPDSIVRHEGSATTRHLGDEVRLLRERNRLWVAFRFGSAASVARALWLSVRRLRHQPRRVHARALAAGLGGAPRRLLERRRVIVVEERVS